MVSDILGSEYQASLCDMFGFHQLSLCLYVYATTLEG